MTFLGRHQSGYSLRSKDESGYLIPVRRLASISSKSGVWDLLKNATYSNDWDWSVSVGRFSIVFLKK